MFYFYQFLSIILLINIINIVNSEDPIFVKHANGEIPDFKWRDLTEKEMKQWYSPVDLCMLEQTDRYKYVREIRLGMFY
jgi:hypothetical protein